MIQLKEMRTYLSAQIFTIGVFGIVLPLPSRAVEVDVSLRGSPNSMLRQNQIAHDLGYDFIRQAAELDSLVGAGVFVLVEGNECYLVNKSVSYPYARPEVRLFIERLAEQYFEGTGERLVVTSLTRPTSEQPRNSHNLSVHPTGIAVDFRLSSQARSRAWLESVLLKLERQGLLDITRERWPPHYHVALFPAEYLVYLENLIGPDAVAQALRFEEEKKPEKNIRVASLPGVEVVAMASVPEGNSTWMFILAGAPIALLIFSMLTILRRSVPEPR